MQLFKVGSPSRAARGAAKPIVTVQEPMNWTWTDPFTIRPPSAGQRVTRAVSSHPETPQLSIPIHMFLLQKINEKLLTLQRFYNVVLLIPWYHQRDWSKMEGRDVGIHIHSRVLQITRNLTKSTSLLLLCHVASVMRHLGLGFKHGSVIWCGWWTTDELWTLFALCERVCVSYEG